MKEETGPKHGEGEEDWLEYENPDKRIRKRKETGLNKSGN